MPKYICKNCHRILEAKDFIEAERYHRMFRDCYDMELVEYEKYEREQRKNKSHLDAKLT